MLAEINGDPLERIRKTSPCLWVGRMDGRSEEELNILGNIRSSFHDLPIILLSANPNVDMAVKAIKLGVHDYMPKGASSERLLLTVEGALKHPAGLEVRRPVSAWEDGGRHNPIAVDPVMLKLIALAKKIARSRTTVLIQGESGTGKEVIARFIHQTSERHQGPFVAVNCAALPETLLESELFGHERGAFTGAVSRKKGKFELANGGTLLLDEISETAVSIQAKLLRVLQEREIDRVGGQFAVPVDARVIATTNRDLEAETREGRFRLDLFYRLNVVPLHLPPLRERVDDIAPLANFFLKTHCSFNQVPVKKLALNAEHFLHQRPWPGNVRELENLMERATLLIDTNSIRREDLEAISMPDAKSDSREAPIKHVLPLKDMEKKMIFRALNDYKGNRTHAAKVLGISVRTLRNKLHEYQDGTKTEALLAGEG